MTLFQNEKTENIQFKYTQAKLDSVHHNQSPNISYIKVQSVSESKAVSFINVKEWRSAVVMFFHKCFTVAKNAED